MFHMGPYGTCEYNCFKVAALACEFSHVIAVRNVRNILRNDWAFI